MSLPLIGSGQGRTSKDNEKSANVIWTSFILLLLAGVLLFGLFGCAAVLPREMVQ